MLKLSVARDEENPFAWYALGMVYDREGDQPRAAMASAERYSLMGQPRLALMSAEQAMRGHTPGHAGLYPRAGYCARLRAGRSNRKEGGVSGDGMAEHGAGCADRRGERGRALCGAAPGGAPASRTEMETLVRDYIMAHPEIIPEAIAKAQENASIKRVQAQRAALETPYPGAVGGNPRATSRWSSSSIMPAAIAAPSVPDIDRLIAEDKGLRVVFREFPILSRESETAARSSLLGGEGRHLHGLSPRHVRRGPPQPSADIAQVEKATGTPRPAQVDAAHDQELEKNVTLARELQLTGTPAFIVGDRILNGAVG